MYRVSGPPSELRRPLAAEDDEDDEVAPTDDAAAVATEDPVADADTLGATGRVFVALDEAAAELADAEVLARGLTARTVALVDDEVTEVVDLVAVAGVDDVALVVAEMEAAAVADVVVKEWAVGAVPVLPDDLAAIAANDNGAAGVDVVCAANAAGAETVLVDGAELVDTVSDTDFVDTVVAVVDNGIVVRCAAGAVCAAVVVVADVPATATALRAGTATGTGAGAGTDMAAATSLAAGVDDVDAGNDIDASLAMSESAVDAGTWATVGTEVARLGSRVRVAAEAAERWGDGDREGRDAGNNDVPEGG
jgi:hypothetical protein